MAAAMAMMQQQQLMLMQQQQMRLASAAMPNMPGLAAAIAPPNSKKQREIYVGNLPSGLNEAVLKELFIQILQGCEDFNTASGPIVLNVQLCGGGQYAFIEFRDEECCETAMQFGGMVLSGKSLKINHPNGYVPQNYPVRKFKPPQELLHRFGLAAVAQPLSGTGPSLLPGVAGAVRLDNKKARELYVGNLCVGVVNAQMLKELFTAPLLTLPGSGGEDASNLAPPVLDVRLDAGGKFSFLEFRDESLATMALQLFNGMELCGRNMVVARPSGYVPTPGSSEAAAAGVGPPPGASAASAASQLLAGLVPNVGAPGGLAAAGAAAAAAILPPAISSGPPPSRKLRLDNMFTSDQLEPSQEEDFQECVEDIRSECERFGEISSFAVPRPHDLQGHPAEAAGQCFVVYASVASSAKAREALDGRDFDGRAVKASYMPFEAA